MVAGINYKILFSLQEVILLKFQCGQMENKGFDNIGDYNSTSSNSVLSNAVSDDVGKKYVTGGQKKTTFKEILKTLKF